MKQYWVYMMTNRNKTVIYTGVTNDLKRRVQEHKDQEGCSFTKTYNLNLDFTLLQAILRESQDRFQILINRDWALARLVRDASFILLFF